MYIPHDFLPWFPSVGTGSCLAMLQSATKTARSIPSQQHQRAKRALFFFTRKTMKGLQKPGKICCKIHLGIRRKQQRFHSANLPAFIPRFSNFTE